MTGLAIERAAIAELAIALRELVSALPPELRPDLDSVTLRFDRTKNEVSVFIAARRELLFRKADGRVFRRRPLPFDEGLVRVQEFSAGAQIGDGQILPAQIGEVSP